MLECLGLCFEGLAVGKTCLCHRDALNYPTALHIQLYCSTGVIKPVSKVKDLKQQSHFIMFKCTECTHHLHR